MRGALASRWQVHFAEGVLRLTFTFETTPDYRRLLAAMDHEPAPVDLLVARTGLTPQVVSSMLLSLEMRGYVTSLPGAAYSRSLHEGSR